MMLEIGKELVIGLRELDGQDFRITGLPFTKFHINNWKGARNSLNASQLILGFKNK